MPINLPDDLLKDALSAQDNPGPNVLVQQKDHIYKLMKMDPYGR